jgi:hypothetical protein
MSNVRPCCTDCDPPKFCYYVATICDCEQCGFGCTDHQEIAVPCFHAENMPGFATEARFRSTCPPHYCYQVSPGHDKITDPGDLTVCYGVSRAGIVEVWDSCDDCCGCYQKMVACGCQPDDGTCEAAGGPETNRYRHCQGIANDNSQGRYAMKIDDCCMEPDGNNITQDDLPGGWLQSGALQHGSCGECCECASHCGYLYVENVGHDYVCENECPETIQLTASFQLEGCGHLCDCNTDPSCGGSPLDPWDSCTDECTDCRTSFTVTLHKTSTGSGNDCAWYINASDKDYGPPHNGCDSDLRINNAEIRCQGISAGTGDRLWLIYIQVYCRKGLSPPATFCCSCGPIHQGYAFVYTDGGVDLKDAIDSASFCGCPPGSGWVIGSEYDWLTSVSIS